MPGLVPCRDLNSDLRPDDGIRDPDVDPDQARGCGAMLLFEGAESLLCWGLGAEWVESWELHCGLLWGLCCAAFLDCGNLTKLRGTGDEAEYLVDEHIRGRRKVNCICLPLRCKES